MKAVIDADIIKYYCAGSPNVEERMYGIQGMDSPEYHYKKDIIQFCNDNGIDQELIEKKQRVINEDLMYEYVDSMIDHFATDLNTTDIELYIGGKTNFRKEIYPEYKAQRAKFFKPVLEPLCHQYLCDVHGAITVEGIEADDAVAMRVLEDSKNHILCSNDKDLDQIPGKHYCTNKREFYHVDQEAADFLLYKQIISGDSTDNIPGAKGYGDKKAAKALEGLRTNRERWQKALEIHGDNEHANLTAQLVYILRWEDDKWIPPIL